MAISVSCAAPYLQDVMPEIKHNMPFEEYLKAPGMSKSKLWKLNAGPEHYLDKTPVVATPAMQFGTWAHLLMLEQDRFLAETCQEHKFDRRTKKGKEMAAIWARDHEGVEQIPEKDMKYLSGMRYALDDGNHTMAQALLDNCDSEVSCFFSWRDIDWKCRFDGLNVDKRLIIEYKTTTSIEAFPSQIFNLGYDVQSAIYRRAAFEYFGKDFDFIFVAQEKKPPYAVSVFNPLLSIDGKPTVNEIGDTRLDNLIEKLKLHKMSDWSLPDGRFCTDQIKPITVPQWALYL